MRTVNQAQITRKTHRLKLAVRKAPYYRELSDGLHIGYRRLSNDSAGRWLVRERQADGRYKERSIGTADDLILPDGDRVLSYDQAVSATQGKAAEIHSGMPMLHQAIDEWLAGKMTTMTNERSRQHVRWQAKTLRAQWSDLALNRVRAADVDKWHKAMVTSTDEHTARSQRATADRKLAHLVAVLNKAVKIHSLKIDRPWSDVMRFGNTAGNPRVNRLTGSQVVALINATEPDLADFIILLAETGIRPGEAYSARVRDWDAPWLSVTGKTGQRTIRVSAGAIRLLDRLTAGANDSSRHILIRSNGLPWRGSTGDLTKAFAEARAGAGMASDVVAYDLRHSFISDALERGAPSVMVARHCGTSVAMLERTYAKFLPQTADRLMGGLSG